MNIPEDLTDINFRANRDSQKGRVLGSIETQSDQNPTFGYFLCKVILASMVMVLYYVCQHKFWIDGTKNTVCNNDQVLYSKYFELYHKWIQKHWDLRVVIVTINSLWINIAGYAVISVMFILKGDYLAGLLTYLTFTAVRGLCQEIIIYQHPIGCLKPEVTPLPGSRPYDLDVNDYYFSGHTASATIILCMYFYAGHSTMAWVSLPMLIYTGLNMMAHRGHYTHDVIIGFMITI